MALEVVKKEISLNVGQPNNFELICAMQGDNKSFEITATLYDVNRLYTINTDNIKLKGVNPLGSNLCKDVNGHTANTVTFALTEDMLAYDGLLKLVLVLAESSTQLTTFPFVIKVVNSPGNTNADDIQTVSALVEEAKKWAMLSKSYAVGTDNEVRKGDAKDNSKYYYEQIKELYDSGKIGNGKILYFETYEEFKKELDAGKVENETLICIKEGNSGEDSGDDVFKIDFDGKKIIYFHRSGKHLYSTNLKKWIQIDSSDCLLAPFTMDCDDIQIAYGNNMLFLLTRQNSLQRFFYTIHDFNENTTKPIWREYSSFQNDLGLENFAIMDFGGEHLIIASRNKVYSISSDKINEQRNHVNGCLEFTEMNGINQEKSSLGIDDISYGNNMFILITSYRSGNASYSSTSWYTIDYINWIEIGSIPYASSSFEYKLIYGNGLFVWLSNYFSFPQKISILDTNAPENGWYHPKSSEDSFYYSLFNDILFDEKNDTFIIKYSKNGTYGFYSYQKDNDMKVINPSININIFAPYIYKGVLFGFILIENKTHWIAIKDISNGEYIDFGEVVINYTPNINKRNYAIIDSPLWDIDYGEEESIHSQEK